MRNDDDDGQCHSKWNLSESLSEFYDDLKHSATHHSFAAKRATTLSLRPFASFSSR